jgi:hypothetical protein
MPEISRFNGIRILMYFRDHNPPHFHAHYGAHKAEVLLNGLLKEGSLPQAQMKLVRDWASARQAELQSRWASAISGQGLEPIEPLK